MARRVLWGSDVTTHMEIGLVALVCCAGVACAEPATVACDDWWRPAPAPSPSPAWRGAVAACERAPACPHTTRCDDPRWPPLADWALDGIAACFAGPCEERTACVAAMMPPAACWPAGNSERVIE